MKARGLTAVAAVLFLVAGQAQAGRALQHSGQALKHSAEAVGYAMVGATQLVFGASAIPFGMSANLGNVSGDMSDAMWEVANAPIGEPLPVAEESISAGPPPNQALANEEQRP